MHEGDGTAPAGPDPVPDPGTEFEESPGEEHHVLDVEQVQPVGHAAATRPVSAATHVGPAEKDLGCQQTSPKSCLQVTTTVHCRLAFNLTSTVLLSPNEDSDFFHN